MRRFGILLGLLIAAGSAFGYSGLAERQRYALSAVGALIVRPDASTAPSASPSITVGSAVASASEPNGSLYLRTAGLPSFRVGSAWKDITLEGGRNGSQVAASSAVTGATEAETAFDQSYAMPANTLKAGTEVEGYAWGKHTATTGSETHTLALKIGSVTVFTSGNLDPATNDYWRIEYRLKCRTAGASGTIVGWARLSYGATGAAPTIVDYFLDSTTLDTTGSNTLAVYIDRQASATDGDSVRQDELTVLVH